MRICELLANQLRQGPTVEEFRATPPTAPTPAPAAGGVAAVFAELNRGEEVTKGLRKVDRSEMTHKNPSLRAGNTVPGSPGPTRTSNIYSTSRQRPTDAGSWEKTCPPDEACCPGGQEASQVRLGRQKMDNCTRLLTLSPN